jgi:hypothetical protein
MLKLVSVAVFGIAALFPYSVLPAQEPPPVEPGDRVRVTAAHGIRNRVGTLRALNNDSIVLENPGLVLPIDSVTQLEVSRGRKSRAGRGALIGLGFGVGIGAAVGFLISQDESGENECRGIEAQCTAIGAASLGLVGAGIGALAGAATKTDRWEEVPLERLRVTFVPQRDGRFGPSVRAAFGALLFLKSPLPTPELTEDWDSRIPLDAIG